MAYKPRLRRSRSFLFVDDVVLLSRKGYLGVQIAEKLGITTVMVSRILRAWGQPRKRGTKGLRCVTCRKPTNGAKRCELHRKIRTAQLNLKAVHRYNQRRERHAIHLHAVHEEARQQETAVGILG